MQGVVAGAVEPGIAREPALGGLDFAVLLLVPVLGEDEFGAQRDRLAAVGRDNDGRDGALRLYVVLSSLCRFVEQWSQWIDPDEW